MTKLIDILVTGSNGYVGSSILRAVLEQGDRDVRAHARSRAIRRHLPSLRSLVNGDLSDLDVCDAALEGVDTVVHAATRGYSSNYPPTQSDLREDLLNSVRLAERALAHDVRRFVLISSVHVYGSSLNGLVTEETPASPTSPYGESRLDIERALSELLLGTPTSLYTVRLANSFGLPGIPMLQMWDTLVHDLCWQVVTSAKIVLRSDPKTLRDIIPISDAASAIIKLLDSNSVEGGLFLLGSGETLTIQAIADLVQQASHRTFGFRPSVYSHQESNTRIPHFTLKSCAFPANGIHITNQRGSTIEKLLKHAKLLFVDTSW